MEVRDFTGCFELDGRDTETMTLRVIVSTGGGGVSSGSGSFALPLALLGRLGEGPLAFRTEAGDRLALVVREVDPADGVAYFLTEGAVPAVRGLARRA